MTAIISAGMIAGGGFAAASLVTAVASQASTTGCWVGGDSTGTWGPNTGANTAVCNLADGSYGHGAAKVGDNEGQQGNTATINLDHSGGKASAGAHGDTSSGNTATVTTTHAGGKAAAGDGYGSGNNNNTATTTATEAYGKSAAGNGSDSYNTGNTATTTVTQGYGKAAAGNGSDSSNSNNTATTTVTDGEGHSRAGNGSDTYDQGNTGNSATTTVNGGWGYSEAGNTYWDLSNLFDINSPTTANTNNKATSSASTGGSAESDAGNGLGNSDNTATASATNYGCAGAAAGDTADGASNNQASASANGSTSLALSGSSFDLGWALQSAGECTGEQLGNNYAGEMLWNVGNVVDSLTGIISEGYDLNGPASSDNQATATSSSNGIAISYADNGIFGYLAGNGATADSMASDYGTAISIGLSGGYSSASAANDATALAIGYGDGSNATAIALNGAISMAIMTDGQSGFAFASGAGQAAYATDGIPNVISTAAAQPLGVNNVPSINAGTSCSSGDIVGVSAAFTSSSLCFSVNGVGYALASDGSLVPLD